MRAGITTIQLPCGARCARVECAGTVTREAAETLVKQIESPPLRGLSFLILTQKMEGMTPEARHVFSDRKDAPDTEWMAVVVTNPVLRVTANFIMRVNRNKRRRLFSGEAEAIRWLDERTLEDAAKPRRDH